MKSLIFGAMALALAASSSALAQTPPETIQPPTPAPLSPEKVAWTQMPTGGQLAEMYPEAGVRQNVSGHATMLCRVLAEGRLADCVIVEESPNGYGFGRATLDAARYFRMKPTSLDGDPVAGRTIRIPMGWRLPAR